MTNVLKKLGELGTKSTLELKAMWEELYQTPAPEFNRTLFIKRLSYKIQEIEYGGLSEEIKLKIKKIQQGKELPKPLPYNMPPAGTQMVREYQGVEHRVTVLQDGQFEYLGCKYKNLSTIAKFITGTHWSGPMFFGLIKRKKCNLHSINEAARARKQLAVGAETKEKKFINK